MNKNAQALSKLGASKGGFASAKKLSPEERSARARVAALARWKKPTTGVAKAAEGSPT